MKIVAEIPARQGSKRIPHKNLRLLDGKPLISYAIRAAKEAKLLNEIYVNSDSEKIGQMAIEQGIHFYKRSSELGGDAATQDEFNYDFIKMIKPDVLVMVNPVSPLIDGNDIDQMIRYFLENKLDTLIAAREEYSHSFYKKKPVNFSLKNQLEPTQNLTPIKMCAWSIGIWRSKTFIHHYETRGHAAFCGKIGFYSLGRFKSLKISTEEDWVLAEILIKNLHCWKFLQA